MSLPVVEQIVAKVVAAIQAVTVANGYNVTVDSVYRPATTDGIGRTPAQNYVVQLILADPTLETIDFGQGRYALWLQPIQLDLVYRPSDKATDPVEQMLNTFWADIVKATMGNTTWDGLALDTEPDAPTWGINQLNGLMMITHTLNVRYRTDATDPYTVK